jgi:hypothetical protein
VWESMGGVYRPETETSSNCGWGSWEAMYAGQAWGCASKFGYGHWNMRPGSMGVGMSTANAWEMACLSGSPKGAGDGALIQGELGVYA